MIYTTLISAKDLSTYHMNPDWAIIDARFLLSNPSRGETRYQQKHIPGAVYAHLERDLSGPIIPGLTGAHPWPDIGQAVRLFSAFGIDSKVQVVIYDDAGGAMAAARVWWMLRWLGHSSAAVLDGGWQAWTSLGYPVKRGIETRPPRNFIPHVRPELLIDLAQVDRLRLDPAYCVFDSRVYERFTGQIEPIYPVAGHIPGARSAPYTDNLNPDLTFRSKDDLRHRFQNLLGKVPANHAVYYCGSGVTSVLNLLAMVHAGIGEGVLYAGSWSEWINDPHRSVTLGEKPF